MNELDVIKIISSNLKYSGKAVKTIGDDCAVFKYIQEEEQEAVKLLEDEMGRSITIKLSDDLHREQFELYEY